jgi:hypothetical protein
MRTDHGVTVATQRARDTSSRVGLLDAWFRRPLSRDGFVERAREAILGAGQIAPDSLVFDSAAFAFTIHTPREQLVFGLDQLFLEYRAAPASERDNVFPHIAATAAERSAPPLTPETARRRLLLQVRPRAQMPPGVHRVVAERLVLCLCLDSAASMRFLVPSDLEAWNFPVEMAFDFAYANLRERSKSPEFVPLKNGVYRSAWLDTYDAARVILPELLTGMLGGKQPVVTIPNRETLLVADRADEKAIRALVEETQGQFQQPRSISKRLLTVIGGELCPLEYTGLIHCTSWFDGRICWISRLTMSLFNRAFRSEPVCPWTCRG